MKPCPYCHVEHCSHEKKFFKFNLLKLSLIYGSIETTRTVFTKLAALLPTTPEMQYKISGALEDLAKASDKVNDVKQWCQHKVL